MNLSQVLDTGIGTLLFLVLFSATASALLEFGQGFARSREKDLAAAVTAMLGEAAYQKFRESEPVSSAIAAEPVAGWLPDFVKRRATAGQSRRLPAMSPETFADGVFSAIRATEAPGSPQLRRAVRMAIGKPPDGAAVDIDQARLALQEWFRRAMAELSAQYRSASFRKLALTGYLAAVVCKASVADVVLSLWKQQPLREAALTAARAQPTPTASSSAGASFVQTVVDQVDQVKQLDFPIGWDQLPWTVPFSLDGFLWYSAWFLVTGALVGLGAQYWFDLMKKLLLVRDRVLAVAVPERGFARLGSGATGEVALALTLRADPVGSAVVGSAVVDKELSDSLATLARAT